MTKDKIDDLVDVLGEEYARVENTFVIRNSEQLVKYLENPDKWLQKQIASRIGFKNNLIGIARSNLKALNEKAEKVFLLSYKEVDKDLLEVTENEIRAKDIPSDVKEQIKKIKEFNTQQVLKLANQSFKTYTKQVQVISRLSTPDTLYDVVKSQTAKGIENGVKIVYSDGKQYSWKAYMEMNVRTTVHQEAVQHQMKAGGEANQIFYICNSFSDCAPDHADYQGKLYYNEAADITEEAQKFIDSNHIQSMQEVVNGEPFLTSRPNCRHEFTAVPTNEVLLKSTDEILEDKKIKFGDYKSENYDALMKQRYNERQIRKWKLRAENSKKLNKETGIKFSDTAKAINKVKFWQGKQRELIKENKSVLKRQYERENAKIMVDNLGVNYKYKVENGELKKKH